MPHRIRIDVTSRWTKSHRRDGIEGNGLSVVLWRISAVVLMCVAATAFTMSCLSHLESIRAAEAIGDEALAVSTAVFVGTIALVLLVEVLGVGARLGRSEQQVRRAMQRIRAGDVGFRVRTHSGEPLARLVHECNSTLEWLNHNPPKGVRIDGDVFDLAADEELEEA